MSPSLIHSKLGRSVICDFFLDFGESVCLLIEEKVEQLNWIVVCEEYFSWFEDCIVDGFTGDGLLVGFSDENLEFEGGNELFE